MDLCTSLVHNSVVDQNFALRYPRLNDGLAELWVQLRAHFVEALLGSLLAMGCEGPEGISPVKSLKYG